MTRQCVVRVEQVFRAYRQLFPARQPQSTGLRLLLLGSMDEYRAFLRSSGFSVSTSAFYSPSENIIVAGSEDQKPTTLTINVNKEGEIRVAGMGLTVARLVSRVEQELARLGGDRGRLTVVIRTDQEGTSQVTNEVVRTLAKLGILRVRIAVAVPQ